MHRIHALSLAMALALGACTDPVRPDGVQGRYSLGFVDGRELPLTVQAGPNCGIAIESGELVLAGDGTFTSTVHGEQHCRRPDGGTTVSTGAFYRHGSYVVSPGTVEMTTETEGTLTGAVKGLSITLPAPAELGRHSLVFLRTDL